MLKKISKHIGLGPIGTLEMILALAIILSRYNLLGIPFSFLSVIIMIIIAFKRGGRIKFSSNKALTYLFIFYIVHDFAWLFIAENTPHYFYNQRITLYTTFLSIFLIYHAVDKEKLYNSINWVALISIIGLIYHCIEISQGKLIEPLNILPFNINRAEAYELLYRPTSFFSEPQSYVSFMIIPLFIALTQKKYVWACIISLSILLSTSSTGVLLVCVIFITHIFTHKMSYKKKAIIILSCICVAFAYLNLDYFSQGRDKMETQDYSTNIRLQTGLIAFQEMAEIDYVLGVPYTVPIDYIKSVGLASKGGGFDTDNNYVFLPTFWYYIIMFGFIGLFLFLNVYYRLLKFNKELLPFIACLVCVMFSNSDTISIVYLLNVTFMLVFVNNNHNKKINQL